MSNGEANVPKKWVHEPAPTLDLRTTVIAWTTQGDSRSTAGKMKLGPLLDEHHEVDWSKVYACTWGACTPRVREGSFKIRRLWLMCQLVSIMVRDGISPEQVHRACWMLKEYRASLAPNIGPPESYKR